MKDFSLLLSEVLQKGICVGCGMCAGVCPKHCLAMDWNILGQYEPQSNSISECISCGLCIKVCPFYGHGSNEDTIGQKLFSGIPRMKHTEETGCYLDTFVGAADDETRSNGASGGAVSWLLKKLLEEKRIDKVITVEPCANPEKRFRYSIVSSLSDVDRCAKSAYYPVEMSGVIREIMAQDCRVAIVGLPCFIKAVTLAKSFFPKLRKNIHFTFGLVCGQGKSRMFTEYHIVKMGAEPQDVASFTYRKKVSGFPSSNYAFEMVDVSGRRICKMWSDGIGDIWGGDYFKQKSCFFCDDIFAECADAAFMDAWLPEFVRDGRGTSLIISRNSLISQLFSNSGTYTDIPVEKVIESQYGVVENKRGFIRYCSSDTDVTLKKRDFSLPLSGKKIRLLQKKYKNACFVHQALAQGEDWIGRIDRRMRGSLFIRLKKQVKKRLKQLLGK